MNFRHGIYSAKERPSEMYSEQEKAWGRLWERVWAPVFSEAHSSLCRKTMSHFTTCQVHQKWTQPAKIFLPRQVKYQKYAKHYITRDARAAEALYLVRTEEQVMKCHSFIHRMGQGPVLAMNLPFLPFLSFCKHFERGCLFFSDHL